MSKNRGGEELVDKIVRQKVAEKKNMPPSKPKEKEAIKTSSKPDVQKIIENYLGDKNLAVDDFFRGKIGERKDGFVKFEDFLNRKKIKKMKLTMKQMKEACANSEELDLSKNGGMVRRKDNKALPAQTSAIKKRNAKALEK